VADIGNDQAFVRLQIGRQVPERVVLKGPDGLKYKRPLFLLILVPDNVTRLSPRYLKNLVTSVPIKAPQSMKVMLHRRTALLADMPSAHNPLSKSLPGAHFSTTQQVCPSGLPPLRS
jgi:hypothetical protein